MHALHPVTTIVIFIDIIISPLLSQTPHSDHLAGVDYNDTTAFLTFFAGAVPGSAQSAVLTIIDDFLEELNETIDLLASLDSDSQAVFSPGRALATINILDNDGMLNLTLDLHE